MLKNKTIFITGATSGFGKVAALHAAFNGARVIALARKPEKGKLLIDDFNRLYPKSEGSIETVNGDLSSFQSTRLACEKVIAMCDHIDMLVNNAGIWNFKPRNTGDGIEETLQVNLISPVFVTHILYSHLKKSVDPKIIFTASGLHQGDIDFENLEFKKRFSGFRVYRQSKLGVILISRLLAKKFKAVNIPVYCQHPGLVSTNLGKQAGRFSRWFFETFGKSEKKGAENLIYLMETDSTNLISGEYYADKQVKRITENSYDLQLADKLLNRIETYLHSELRESSPVFAN